MRGLVPELPSTRPIASYLPAMLAGDEFCVRFTEGLDPVMAPILSTIDNLESYTDPMVTPSDFLDWLAGWFGIELDATWPELRRRELVNRAVELFRWRGTVHGLRVLAELYTGHPAIVEDGGGVWGTLEPGGTLPGESRTDVTVRVRLDEGTSDADLARLRRWARTTVPAHIRIRIEAEG